MIQRIQTVWWLLSIAALATFFFLPLFETDNGFFTATNCTGLLIAAATAVILTIINIFAYANRTLQTRIGYALIFLHLLIFFFIGAHYFLDKGTQFFPWAALPVASLLFQTLAIRAVKKDEALIKSMDRLR